MIGEAQVLKRLAAGMQAGLGSRRAQRGRCGAARGLFCPYHAAQRPGICAMGARQGARPFSERSPKNARISFNHSGSDHLP